MPLRHLGPAYPSGGQAIEMPVVSQPFAAAAEA